MAEKPDLGLRERKKRATMLAIEQAAVDLVLEHGFDAVSVEMICEAAGVSQRSFFNYAGSKSGAVLGPALPRIALDIREAFLSQHVASPLEDLLSVVAMSFNAISDEERSLLEKRHLIMQREPQLLQGEFGRMHEAKSFLHSLVIERFTLERGEARNEEEVRARADEAAAVVFLATGAIHHTSIGWARANSSFDIRQRLFESLDLFRRALKK